MPITPSIYIAAQLRSLITPTSAQQAAMALNASSHSVLKSVTSMPVTKG